MNDYLRDCMSDLGERNPQPFKETFCNHCRNTDCVNAKWSQDKFGERVTTQVDRLFKTPRIEQTPRYAMLVNFIDASREAMRLEISDQRGDWTLPEESKTSLPLFVAAQPQPQPLPEHPEPEPKPEPEPLVETTTPPLPVKPKEPLPTPKIRNLPPPPPDGIMIGGGNNPPSTPAKPVDTWEPKPAVVTVQPGARIKMGGNKPNE